MNTALLKGNGGTAISHSKESLSLAYMQAILAATGLNHNEPKIDNDGVDITIRGKGFKGVFKEPKIEVQLKCTAKSDCIDLKNNELVFQLEKKNYNYLIGPSPLPLILVVHFAPPGFDEWLIEKGEGTTIKYASYWYSLYGEEPIDNGSRIIRIPLKQRFDCQALIKMMELTSKAQMIYNLEEGVV
ncbi:DUF4365 domain-containing protein [Halomonas citrativorans]|uniref:DUF4365 domain-containing protein n=1 Tax=Halomonas citrativorans TaxID=2742612 RepID=A0ABR9FBU7_9GAMM|nr:DUF4365 domain-containing protein [Halomonas citrativorans]MBE0403966.1 DUF4365 domain-containing protein [Halomonas citrativorans]